MRRSATGSKPWFGHIGYRLATAMSFLSRFDCVGVDRFDSTVGFFGGFFSGGSRESRE
jgi:hypothetical protein